MRRSHLNCAAVRLGDLGCNVEAKTQALLAWSYLATREWVEQPLHGFRWDWITRVANRKLELASVFAVTVTGSPFAPWVNALPSRLEKSCPIRTGSAINRLGQCKFGLDDGFRMGALQFVNHLLKRRLKRLSG